MSGAATHTDYSGRVQMKRAYKFRACPTRPQEGRAVHLLADHCDLYNAAMGERREAWRRHSASISCSTQSARLRAIRAADPDGQGGHSFTAQQQTRRRLDAVVRAFYARARAGGADVIADLPRRMEAEEAGRRVVLVNPARTSTNCHQCGARCHRPRQNPVICPEHGGMDADITAARNIATRAGLDSGHACTA
jgi:hypothetical protein